jgi:hypothetical protein
LEALAESAGGSPALIGLSSSLFRSAVRRKNRMKRVTRRQIAETQQKAPERTGNGGIHASAVDRLLALVFDELPIQCTVTGVRSGIIVWVTLADRSAIRSDPPTGFTLIQPSFMIDVWLTKETPTRIQMENQSSRAVSKQSLSCDRDLRISQSLSRQDDDLETF